MIKDLSLGTKSGLRLKRVGLAHKDELVHLESYGVILLVFRMKKAGLKLLRAQSI